MLFKIWGASGQILTDGTHAQLSSCPRKRAPSGQALRMRPWTPAFAGATEKEGWVPYVWFIPLVSRERIAKRPRTVAILHSRWRPERRKQADGIHDHPVDRAYRRGSSGPRSEPGRRRRDPRRAEPRLCRPSRAGGPRPGIHPAAIHRRRPGVRRAVPARQARDARAGLSADLLRLERADRAGQALHLGRDLSHRPFQSSDPAQGDDAVSGFVAEQRRRHPVRQHARGL